MFYKDWCRTVLNLTFLVPSTSSVSSLKIASADNISCTMTFMKFLYFTYFCNSLYQTRKSMKYESFDLPSVFTSGVTTRPDSCGTVPIIYLKSRVPKVSLNVPHHPILLEIFKSYKLVLHEKEILQAAKSNKKYSFNITN